MIVDILEASFFDHDGRTKGKLLLEAYHLYSQFGLGLVLMG